jgi:hypothetical protein
MMEAARTSETSVYIQLRTRQFIPEDSELHTRRRENFKSDIINLFLFTSRQHSECDFVKMFVLGVKNTKYM